MRNRLVIFDGNHLAYRAYYKFGSLKTIEGTRTGVIYGMPYIAESLIRRLGATSAVMTFDGGRHKSRLELLPDYKKRDKKLGFDAEDFFFQKDEGMKLFMALGLKVAWAKGWEADDIIAQIARRYSQSGWDVIIVSADKDFHQLIQFPVLDEQGEITMFNPAKGKEFGYTTISKEVGYTPEQCVDYLCLRGDKSDNIPGYPGIGEKRAIQFLGQFGSIKAFLKSDQTFGKMDKDKLRDIYKRNKGLIDLKFFYRKFMIKIPIPWVNPGILDMDELRIICPTYEINTFIKPQFLNTFKKLQNG